MDDELTIRVETDERGPSLIRLGGRLTFSESERLFSTVRSVVDGGCLAIVFDFLDLKYVDSTGLARLIASHALCEERGGALYMTNLSAMVMELFNTTRLVSKFLIRDRPETALNELLKKNAE